MRTSSSSSSSTGRLLSPTFASMSLLALCMAAFEFSFGRLQLLMLARWTPSRVVDLFAGLKRWYGGTGVIGSLRISTHGNG